MARSQYVYVVEKSRGAGQFSQLIAAFTVKHELATWLYRRHDKDVYVTRLEDGPVGGDASRQADIPAGDLVQQGYEQVLARWERTLPKYRGEKPQPPGE